MTLSSTIAPVYQVKRYRTTYEPESCGCAV